MHRHSTRTVSALALALAVGAAALAAPAPAAGPRKPQPAHLQLAQSHVQSLQAQLGLGPATGFTVHNAITNRQGTTIVRLQQTHQGHPVLGGTAIVQLGADGAVRRMIPALAAGIQLAGAPALSAAQAQAIALASLGAKGRLDGDPKVTQVVFPSRQTGGFVTRLDPATHRIVLDRDMSIWAKRPAADYVWAYVVSTALNNTRDGMKQICFVVDGDTGVILRKWDAVKRASATGTGNSLYNGVVQLTTTDNGDGTFTLIDPTRGSQPNPFWMTANTGLQTFYTGSFWYDPFQSMVIGDLPFSNTSNVWGTSQPFLGTGLYTDPVTGSQFWTGANSPMGETAAVDAQYGMATTWDFFQNVFGRDGLDGAGMTINALVHDMVPNFRGGGYFKRTNHLFSGGSGWFSWGTATVILGDGSYPEDPLGTYPQTELDIVAHEMAHALSYATVNFDPNSPEPQVLEEGFCDIFGQAVKAYAQRQPEDPIDVIPDLPASDLTKWTLGWQADRGQPERYHYKPSLDGISPDGWYDGIGNLWPWYSSGPVDRMFFFLSAGASANPDAPDASPYLPTGMTGVGMDKAAKIMYLALTANMTSESTFQDFLVAAQAAATTLYPDDSAVANAVADAFYAINIGDGAPGRTPHVHVTMPLLHPDGSLIGNGGTNFWPGLDARIQFFPPQTPVKLLVDVTVPDPAMTKEVTWSTGTIGNMTQVVGGGTFNADGTWTTPVSPNQDWEPFLLVATSKAEPAQFAKGSVIIAAIDADLDTENDALDLGQIAMCWGLGAPGSWGANVGKNPFPAASIWSDGSVGDWDVALFSEVLSNTYPAK